MNTSTTEMQVMKNTKRMMINGNEVTVKRFVTRSAADKFIAKKGGEIVFYRAHEYFVSVAA
jgi:hypothetical protein